MALTSPIVDVLSRPPLNSQDAALLTRFSSLIDPDLFFRHAPATMEQMLRLAELNHEADAMQGLSLRVVGSLKAKLEGASGRSLLATDGVLQNTLGWQEVGLLNSDPKSPKNYILIENDESPHE